MKKGIALLALGLLLALPGCGCCKKDGKKTERKSAMPKSKCPSRCERKEKKEPAKKAPMKRQADKNMMVDAELAE